MANELPKTSPVSEYLAEVSRTIATHGHRDVKKFMEAANKAQQALGFSIEVRGYATIVRDLLVEGQKTFKPGYQYFDATVAVEYAALVAKYNSLNL